MADASVVDRSVALGQRDRPAIRSSWPGGGTSVTAPYPVRPVRPEDAAAWLRMRVVLWSDGSEAEHAGEIDRFFAGNTDGRPAAVLVAENEGGHPIGFVELAIRRYAEGCATDRVAYLEGWYVEPAARRRGVGRALIGAAEDWGRAQGCTEFASDAHPENAVSAAAHRRLGFIDAGLIRCFRKDLPNDFS